MTVHESTPLIHKKKTPLPKFQLGLVLLLMFSEPISGQYIFPFVNQVSGQAKVLANLNDSRLATRYVADSRSGHHGWRRKEDWVLCRSHCEWVHIANPSGSFIFHLQESLFYVAQALTTLHWSRLSDHVGRKPVLLIGLMGLSISNMCFGLSTTFWTIVARY